MTKVSRRSILAAAGATVILAAGGSVAGPEPALAADDTEIRFLYVPAAYYAPFFLAADKGYYAQFGANVALLPKTGTAETVQLLASANAEAGGSSWGAGIFNVIKSGLGISIVATQSRLPASGRSPSPFVVAEKAYEAGIRQVADLKGKRIGIPGPGGYGEYATAKALATGGLTLDDVELVNIGPPDAAAAFANGGLEAGWSIEPFATQIERQGIARNLVDSPTPGAELGFVAFNTDFVKEHEEAVVAFLAGYLKAARELDAGGWKNAANKVIIAKYTGVPADVLDGIAFTVWPSDGSIDLASVRDQEAFFRTRGSLDYEGTVDLETAYRRDLIGKASALLDASAAEPPATVVE